MTDEEFRCRVVARLSPDPETGCLLWPGAKTGLGYGIVKHSVNGRKKNYLVHRLMYEWFTGPIPPGLEIDHLCRVRLCAAPAHLEAVTRRENLHRSPVSLATIMSARTHCPEGHPYDEANTWQHQGKRTCLTCHRTRSRIGMQLLRDRRKAVAS